MKGVVVKSLRGCFTVEAQDSNRYGYVLSANMRTDPELNANAEAVIGTTLLTLGLIRLLTRIIRF